ncbi:transglutaminase family protein [Flavobacteriaceae bacterium GSB9]|nr:transglutaminase family protein [Flavobacteriaceae bacterium GSB9]
MATFFIKHITKYSYSDKVIDGANFIRLHPINDAYQKVNSHFITITNNPYIDTFFDFYNNHVGTFMVTEPHYELSITSEIEVETTSRLLPNDLTEAEIQWNYLKTNKHHVDFLDFLMHRPFTGSQEILDLFKTIKIHSKTPYKAVLELCEYIYENFEYKKGITNVNTSLDDIWNLKAGVCQDFTAVLLQMFRMLGIPARYVSGYICSSNNDTIGEDATHAWIEAYIPFYGWLGIDPTNNAIADENHVRLAIGRKYSDCSPVKGVFKGNVESKMEVSVEVKTDKHQKTVPISSTTDYNNSFQRNLELSKQQNQQQQ